MPRINPRIKGVEARDAGPITKMLYGFTQRSLGKLTGQDAVPEPMKIMAHQPSLVRAMAHMEMVQSKGTLDPKIKTLASLRVSTLAGCPF